LHLLVPVNMLRPSHLLVLVPATTDVLPSFPTRRSSDLSPAGPGSRRVASFAPRSSRVRSASPAERRERCSRKRPSSRNVVTTARSEEHTSELQSREKLVCRPLLETTNTSVHATACGASS